jgi:asparagine synthase (glutamine-hydrolysing)
MSGFLGIARQDGKPIADQLLQGICDRLRVRGPDGSNVWKQNDIAGCFAFMRTGPAPQAQQQPVSRLDRFWLWGDLRLDGRDELQQALSRINCSAETTSEELLLHGWAAWGPACLERIIGDFSFALWDAAEKTWWCARDFVGARPFFYAHVAGVFCFSNTLPLLRRVPEVSGQLDEVFLGDFLTHGWNVDLERTVYRDIRRLPPGHLLKLSKESLTVQRFRKLPIDEPLQLNRPEEYLEAFRSLLKVAVADRLPRDAVSLHLSGGLDSAAICAVASEIAATRSQKRN